MKGRKADLKPVDGGLAGVPKAPPEVPASMVGEWNTIAADLVERKLMTASMTGVLSTYIIAMWTVREAQAAIAEHGMLVDTAHKMKKPNPACGAMSKALEQVSRLSAELGLTPAARSKKDIRNPKGGSDEGAPPGMVV